MLVKQLHTVRLQGYYHYACSKAYDMTAGLDSSFQHSDPLPTTTV